MINNTRSSDCGIISYPIRLLMDKPAWPSPGDDKANDEDADELMEESEAMGDLVANLVAGPAEGRIHMGALEMESPDDSMRGSAEILDREHKRRRIQGDCPTLSEPIPLWERAPGQVSHAEYASLYRALSNDWEDPLAVKHFSVQGQIVFRSVLFVPRAPFGLFKGGTPVRQGSNIKLYERHALMTDSLEEMIPRYLAFVEGLVDRDNLLSIPHEVLRYKALEAICNTIVNKSLEMIEEIAEREYDYCTFYAAFGQCIKLGVCQDEVNRPRLADLLRFPSSAQRIDCDRRCDSTDVGPLTSLQDYVLRMREDQKEIFYVTGDSLQAVRDSPVVGRLRRRGCEVLFMVDPVDECVVQHVQEYLGMRLVSCASEGLPMAESGDEMQASWEQQRSQVEPLCRLIQEVLGEKVDKVVASASLGLLPCALLHGGYGWSGDGAHAWRTYALCEDGMSSCINGCRTLEINPDNSIVQELKARFEANSDESVQDLVRLLYDTALLASGSVVRDPRTVARRIHDMVQRGLGLHLPCERTEAMDTD